MNLAGVVTILERWIPENLRLKLCTEGWKQKRLRQTQKILIIYQHASSHELRLRMIRLDKTVDDSEGIVNAKWEPAGLLSTWA